VKKRAAMQLSPGFLHVTGDSHKLDPSPLSRLSAVGGKQKDGNLFVSHFISIFALSLSLSFSSLLLFALYFSDLLSS
jgi:hypothetical protein